MKETDPYICEWCNRPIEENITSIPILGIEENDTTTRIYWMHRGCRQLAAEAIDEFIETQCLINDNDEHFKPKE